MRTGQANRVVLLLVGLLLAAMALPVGAGENPFPSDWFWGDAGQRKKQDAMIGRPMPNLWLSDWINGPLKKEDMKGKILVVDFWATWCGPCIRSIPHNNEMAEKYKDDGVLVIGVCGSGRGQEKFAQVVKEHSIAYPVARDRAQRSAKAWRLMWWPTYAVVDRQGVVRAVGMQPNHVEDVLEVVLAEQPLGAEEEEEEAEEVAADLGYEPLPAALLEGTEADRIRLTGLEGGEPPALRVQGWINSSGITKEEMEGKVVLIDFWATWCAPCIKSIPHTNELMEKYGPEGLVVLGVCHTRGSGKMAATAKKHGIAYPVAADVKNATVDAYRVNGYPDYYLIDRSGKLRAADVKNGRVEEAVELLLAEPVPGEEAEVEEREGEDEA